MNVLASSSVNTIAIVLIVLGVVVFAAVLIILLYVLVFSHNAYKKQVRELEKKYSFFDALLVGTDSQYIHHLELVSRTNLLYVEKYNTYSKRFKEVFDNDDKFAESMIKQLNSLIASGQYKNIKLVIADARKAVTAFEEAVNALDAELYQIIKPEEDARQAILKLKEDYRRVKQTFYSHTNELELVANSFTKVFDKLDTTFVEFEGHIESAEYDEANALLPTISRVITALEKTLEVLPNLCIMVQSVVPEKIENLSSEYSSVERKGIPLFNLSYRHRVETWNKTLAEVKAQLIELRTKGALEKINNIQEEIDKTREQLNYEVNDKDIFEEAADKLYRAAIVLEKEFLKICSLLPEVEKIYIISDEQKVHIEELKASMNRMGNSKRTLDNFVHSGTKQPYSILRHKLDDLQQDYDAAEKGLNDFKTYIESLKTSCEEAYSLIFVYFYRCKQTESLIREMNVSRIGLEFETQIENVDELLNDIDATLKVQPIDVSIINDKVEQLKLVGNRLFDDVDNKYREEQLAESAIVYANRDRSHQTDVHQQLSSLEGSFFDGEFVKVYHNANAIYRRMHVEEASDNGAR